MASIKSEPAPHKLAVKEAWQGGLGCGTRCLCHGWCCPQPQGARGRPGRTCGHLWVLWTTSAQPLLLLAEGRLSGPGPWCCLWVLEGGKGPQLSHPDDTDGLEVTLGRELVVVHHSHPTQEVQVLGQVHQLLAHREPQHVTHQGPCAVTGPGGHQHAVPGTCCLCRGSRGDSGTGRSSSPSSGPPAAAGTGWSRSVHCESSGASSRCHCPAGE